MTPNQLKYIENMKGKPKSVETRRKISESKRGVSVKHEGQFIKGQKPWNYIDGKGRLGVMNKARNSIEMATGKRWEEVDKPADAVIHHRDKDVLNSNFDNLQIMSRADHTAMHHAMGDIR